MKPTVRLTAGFLERVAATGLSDSAIAAAIGVTRQYYSQVKAGVEGPSTRFLAGAVLAGLAESFGDVAEVDRTTTSRVA